MNIDEGYETLNKLLKELERKVASLDENQSIRIKALEFANSMYINNEGERGNNTAKGFIAFADEVYKYIKEGTKDA